MVDKAWSEVDTMTIQNCWHKAGILPDLTSTSSHASQPSIPISSLVHNTLLQTDPIVEAERQVTSPKNEDLLLYTPEPAN
jgi:hypothetical protein